MFIFEKVGHSKFVEMHGDTSDFFQFASNPIGMFYLKLRSIYRTVADRPVAVSTNYSSFVPLLHSDLRSDK